MDAAVLSAIGPLVILLALGVLAALASHGARTSPIVGYLLLGLILSAADLRPIIDSHLFETLAELGVVLLLFDLGLQFSLTHIREHARDIFGFGPVQVLFATVGLLLASLAIGFSFLPAMILGATLALSSTAVVARLIAARHQQNCPVGLTATAILIFQDLAAILLLIVANSLGGAAVFPAIGLALLKGALAFGVTIAIAKLAVRPLFDLVARTRADEVFTAMALFVVLAAGWAAGQIGLSLTLGAFLGGVTFAETPYRPTVQVEIKPFKGLLLGLFFISVGAALDLHMLAREWPQVILVAAGIILIKILTNIASSLIFRWSVPGSTQLGFLLAQGSEFAFVILSLPTVRKVIGDGGSSVVIAAVALTLALTPLLASAGRSIAGSLRRRKIKTNEAEMTPHAVAPVLIVGMGRRGRTLADALLHFGIDYYAVERDHQRLSEAIADGYSAVFGDMADSRLWTPIGARDRQISVITAPTFDESQDLTHYAHATHPGLKRIAAVSNSQEAERYRRIGVEPAIDVSEPPGLELSAYVLRLLKVDNAAIVAWEKGQRARAAQIAETTAAA
ncbi:MAG TPA: cation:proton antiporter [Hyphomicrobium sp.]